jgi:hypothetical protein
VAGFALAAALLCPRIARGEPTVTVAEPTMPAKPAAGLFDNEAAIPNGTPCPGESGLQQVRYVSHIDVTPQMRADFAAATKLTTARAYLFTYRNGPNRVLVRNDEPIDAQLRSRLHEFGAMVVADGKIPECPNLGGVFLIVVDVATGAVHIAPIGLAPSATKALY